MEFLAIFEVGVNREYHEVTTQSRIAGNIMLLSKFLVLQVQPGDVVAYYQTIDSDEQCASFRDLNTSRSSFAKIILHQLQLRPFDLRSSAYQNGHLHSIST